ncbi:AraC family transcriptional regulator [Cohnella fermenti]|uniref:Helix-turn-helix domain-containing protein n=1 Tax=Cohnella fermenti TaxID=2565925 RepID=A0A4S4BH14_9BACL|nr:AraC family transcriptional regulator [Cohnella fermenti]THF73785.1 helix-turn-helix domain-containing protein [Cohnella fermenti]
MNERPIDAQPASLPLFRFDCLDRLEGERLPASAAPGSPSVPAAIAASKRAFAELHTLLLVDEGQGNLVVDGRVYSLERGKSLLLAPGMLIESEPDGLASLRGFRLGFEALREATDGGSRRVFRAAACLGIDRVELPRAWFRELHHLASRLAAARALPPQQRDFKMQPLFYALVYRLLELLAEDRSQEADRAILRVVREMELRYQEPLSRDGLAGIAGMSPWHFSHTFKKETGASPHRFLAGIRMKRAQELLLTGAEWRDVALRVGYAEETSFRRAFKEAVGLSPAAFASRKNERIASVSYHYAAHLLALDIVPYAAPIDRSREQHRRGFHDRIPVHLKRGKSMPPELWRYNLQHLADSRPQIILHDENIPDEVEEQLRKIAPAVAIPWMADNWRTQFRRISAILGKEREAAEWIGNYELRAADIGSRIRERVGEGTVALLHIMLGELVIYGKRNGGAVLFEDLKLRPAYEWDGSDVFRTIAEDDLTRCDPSRILLVVDSDDASVDRWERLRRSAEWNGLRAVREDKLHRIAETPWLEYSPHAHALVLEEALRLFRG